MMSREYRTTSQRHCEELCDEAIQLFLAALDCFATARNDGDWFFVARMSEAISGERQLALGSRRALRSSGLRQYLLRHPEVRALGRASKDVLHVPCSWPSFEARKNAHLRMTP